jgi:hypothetical protein
MYLLTGPEDRPDILSDAAARARQAFITMVEIIITTKEKDERLRQAAVRESAANG